MKSISISLTVPQLFEIRDILMSAVSHHQHIFHRITYGELCVFQKSYFKIISKCNSKIHSRHKQGKRYKFSFNPTESEIICKMLVLVSERVLLTTYAKITVQEFRQQSEQQSESLKSNFLSQFYV